ncbi:hypothetical protein DL771_005784 [Monosporascus sp. 5C6A]|nr:hypothetical protein DL771_005784 [Monosporascus sp. 5C6A]
MNKCREAVTHYLAGDYQGEHGNPPYYAPPLFKHGNLILSQTSSILMYLGPKLGLAGSRENDAYRVNALALTALDGLSNEVHNCHHPIIPELYYEEQKEESLRRSKEWIKIRLLSILAENLEQCLDGVQFAFPKAMNQARESGKYNQVFQLWNDVKARPNIAAYLGSDRRQKYDWGIYRYYPDNDVLPE